MKKLIIFTLMFLFLFSYVSAVRVDYSPNDKGIKDMKAVVKDTILFGLISVGEKGTMELKSHNTIYEKRGVEINTLTKEVNPAGIGLIYETNFGNEHKDALTNVKIIDMRTGKEVERDWRFVYSSDGQWEIPIYKEVCSKEEQLKEEYERNCDWVFDYYKYEPRKVWNVYDNNNIPKGKFELGIEIEIKEGDYLDIVLEIQGKKIDKHAQVIEGIAEYIYTAGSGNQSVVKYDKDFNIVAVSPSYGGNIYSISLDDDYVYYGGSTTQTVRKAYKTNLTTITDSPSYGGDIRSIAVDNDYIYYGGQTTQTVRKAYKSNLTTITDSPNNNGNIRSIAVDNDYIYYSGQTTNTVRKAYKTNLTTITDSPDYGAYVRSIAIDNNYVYYSGGSTETVRKAYKTNLTTITDSPSYDNNPINSITVDDNYVYYGGETTETVRKAYKTNLTTITDSPSYGIVINSITVDDDYVYYGGGTQTVRKAYKTNLTTITNSPSYGGNILSISLEASSGLEISLTSPIDYYNSSSSTIDFSANLTDEGDLGIQNVSLVINDIIYDTNTSGLTGVYNFSETLSDGFYEWYIEAYDDTDEYYTSEIRYFTIDTLAPSIEILSPVTSYNYLQPNQTIDLNVSITDASDHLDSCWYEYNSSIIYFNCSENQTFNYVSDVNNLTVYANDTFGNEGSESVSWTTNIILNELNYTESLYETENTSYNINIDYNQSIQTQIKLNYNGTNHSFSNLGSGNFNLNIDIPLVNTTTTYTNKILFISNNSIVHEEEFNQTITPINLALCNGTYTIPALNYTLYDELTQLVINSATNPTTFKSFTEFWLGNGTIKKEYVTNEINKDKRSYAFCILPSNKTYNTNMNVEFSATGYTPRTYALSNAKLTNVSNNVSLYLLNSESAVKFTIEVKKGTNWISDSNIVINKYYLGLNQYIPVSIRTTDASGKFIEYFEIDSKIRFDISQDDVFLGSIEREMLCSATPCEMTLNLEDISTNPYQLYDETYAENVVYNLKYNSTTKMMTANFLDTTGLATYFRFEVKRTGDELPACDDTVYAPSGSFNCNLTNKDGEYEGTLYVSRSPEKKVDSIFAILSGFVDALGKNGLLIALMMIVIVALVGSWNPAVGIALMSMTILMMGFLNFVAFPQTTIMLILVLSIIIIVRLKS